MVEASLATRSTEAVAMQKRDRGGVMPARLCAQSCWVTLCMGIGTLAQLVRNVVGA